MPGKIKINFKMPPETAAEKMYRKHQELRKKSGLPDPSHYKNLAAQKQKEIDAMKNEETATDRLKKYIRPVTKTTPKIEKTTEPAGRTTDHTEWKVTGPSGEIKRFKSKQEAHAHYDSFKEEVEELDEISTQLKTSYRQKAIADIRALRPHTQKGEYKDLAKNVMKKRQAGVNRSVKEETEKLDELSSGTLDSYVSKASRSMSRHYRTKGINKALTKSLAKAVRKPQNESAEQLDEMPESSMKTRDVHAHLKKSGWALARSSGGHDVYKHPKAKHSIPVPRHNQLKAPLIRGIMKASRVSEETEIEEQLEKKGRFVSGPPKKTFKASTIVSPIREAKDPREYDYEGDMAMSQLRSLMFNAQDMMDMMDENTNLPEWVQSKITLAEDYVSTAANYLRGELNEEVKDEYARKVDKYLRKKYGKEKQPQGADFAAKRRKERLAKNSRMDESDASWAAAKEKEKEKRLTSKDQGSLSKIRDMMAKERAAKAAKMKEEVELNEGRPSQRHPLEGHDYHKKSNAELIGIAKDAHAAAEAMKSHSPTAENKYRDQANDSATVRYFRQKSGMPDWYKKKYGHVKEETEVKKKPIVIKTNKLIGTRVADIGPGGKEHNVKTNKAWDDQKKMKEETEYLEEKNVPTSPEKWAQAKSQAKSKFDVYPSAYANGWAAKKYKEMGGDWKSVKEETEKPASRKAQIVKSIMKNKKNDQEESTDKFQKDPEISSEIQKN